MGYMFLFLIGFGLAVTGGVTTIAYMNFLPAGVSWVEYFIFIKGRIEFYFLPIGLLIMTLVIYRFPNKP
ncbi:hypothetical protein GMD78_19695 [Ornithinibacillus sp. L9]|uniref:Uncharacterized protein n=1 Tax=Ornithinibacillus caprae TaxID=2678566 RepID=A0A6N8FPK1_9BACI|nr:hypothetical protein [Ornithinibacillus caprae]MUK90584.1 hypothetical protein [Ornithinibacillus caprae]